MVEFFQQQISAIREKFPHIRWIIYAVLGIQFLWRLWNGAGDMIDAYSHFQFLAQHRQETIDGLKTGIDAIFSPIGSIVTMFLGIAYLIADNRARKAEKQRAPLIAEATHPNVDRRTSDLEPQRGVSTQHKTLTSPLLVRRFHRQSPISAQGNWLIFVKVVPRKRKNRLRLPTSVKC
jgi:hypothetical protein